MLKYAFLKFQNHILGIAFFKIPFELESEPQLREKDKEIQRYLVSFKKIMSTIKLN